MKKTKDFYGFCKLNFLSLSIFPFFDCVDDFWIFLLFCSGRGEERFFSPFIFLFFWGFLCFLSLIFVLGVRERDCLTVHVFFFDLWFFFFSCFFLKKNFWEGRERGVFFIFSLCHLLRGGRG